MVLRAGFGDFRVKMAYAPPKDDVRPRRSIAPPAWLDDFEAYIPPTATRNTARYSAAVEEEREWSQEGYAEMTPLTQHSHQPTQYSAEFNMASSRQTKAAAPAYESTPLSYQVPEVMDILQQLREENRRLQMTMMDMR